MIVFASRPFSKKQIKKEWHACSKGAICPFCRLTFKLNFGILCQRLFMRGFRFQSSAFVRRRVGLWPTRLLIAREKKPSGTQGRYFIYEDYQPLFGKMSPHSSTRRMRDDQRPDPAEIQPTVIGVPEIVISQHR